MLLITVKVAKLFPFKNVDRKELLSLTFWVGKKGICVQLGCCYLSIGVWLHLKFKSHFMYVTVVERLKVAPPKWWLFFAHEWFKHIGSLH